MAKLKKMIFNDNDGNAGDKKDSKLLGSLDKLNKTTAEDWNNTRDLVNNIVDVVNGDASPPPNFPSGKSATVSDGSITTSKLADKSVTAAKMSDHLTSSITNLTNDVQKNAGDISQTKSDLTLKADRNMLNVDDGSIDTPKVKDNAITQTKISQQLRNLHTNHINRIDSNKADIDQLKLGGDALIDLTGDGDITTKANGLKIYGKIKKEGLYKILWNGTGPSNTYAFLFTEIFSWYSGLFVDKNKDLRTFRLKNDGTFSSDIVLGGGGVAVVDLTGSSGANLYNGINKLGTYKININANAHIVLITDLTDSNRADARYGLTSTPNSYFSGVSIAKNGTITLVNAIVDTPANNGEIANKGYVDQKGFTKADYFTNNAELLTKNDTTTNTTAHIGSQFTGGQTYGAGAIGSQSYGNRAIGNQHYGYYARGVQYYGNRAASSQYYGLDATGDFRIGQTAKGSKPRMYAGDGSSDYVEFSEIVEHHKKLEQSFELMGAFVFDATANTWTFVAGHKGDITSVTNIKSSNSENLITIQLPENLKGGKYKIELSVKTDNENNNDITFPDAESTIGQVKQYNGNNTGSNWYRDSGGHVLKDIDMAEDFRLSMILFNNGKRIDIETIGKRFASRTAKSTNRPFYKFESAGTLYNGTNRNKNVFEDEIRMTIEAYANNTTVGLSSGSFLYFWREASE